MKHFTAPYISDDFAANDFELLSARINDSNNELIDNLLWSESGYRPHVAFRMAYTSESILLKFMVREKYIKADYHQINDPVYKDSCVELFIAFDNDPAYYNLEFNYLGTALVGYGCFRTSRTPIEKQWIEKIKSYSIQPTENKNDKIFEWELILKIPFSLFQYNNIKTLENQVCKVNLYKCGDDLPEPHYLSWNNITNPEPNFHLPEFFGEVRFIK
jgi:hypothetical protein